ncbi:unknown [Clostridium sp. CAG:813]|nr:unknown [Clostridium sp. CAG:813]
MFDSLITKIPENLQKVTGRVECSKAQYEKFGADLERISGGKVFVHN